MQIDADKFFTINNFSLTEAIWTCALMGVFNQLGFLVNLTLASSLQVQKVVNPGSCTEFARITWISLTIWTPQHVLKPNSF